MTKFPDLFAALASPFAHGEVKARQAPGGRQLQYVTARTVMNRLDDVVGPEDWWDEFFPMENSVLCKLTLRLPDGSTVTKADAGGYAGMADQGDDDKSGFSDAFKRAAAKFGVGRYLYRDGVPTFATGTTDGPAPGLDHDVPPGGPDRPGGGGPDRRPEQPPAPRPVGNPPRTGKALFAWVKEQESLHDVGLLKYLNNWSKLQDWPGRMVDWDESQVGQAYSEAIRKLQEAGKHAATEPPIPPPAREVESDDPAALDAARHELGRLAGQVAYSINKVEPSPESVRVVLRAMAPNCGGKEIFSIRTCGDLGLLKSYIAECRFVLEGQGGSTAA